MRRLLTFACEGTTCAATLDGRTGATGIVFVTGGTQTRFGSHRMSERLAAALAAKGYPCFRFDRRGVGDSDGEDPGFRGSAPDLSAAVTAFTSQCGSVRRVIGFGLCDGATALALFGREAGVDGLILANPWLVEAEPDAPPPAAIKQHYRERLRSKEAWKKLLTGRISYGKALRGLAKVSAPSSSDLAADTAAALGRGALPVSLILARGDATAIAAEAEWKTARFDAVRAREPEPSTIDSDSHTFAKPGDDAALLASVLAALRRFDRLG
jgi:exosortase A-associated hydrolase 1